MASCDGKDSFALDSQESSPAKKSKGSLPSIAAASAELEISRLETEMQLKRETIKSLRVEVRLSEEKAQVAESKRIADSAYNKRIISHLENYVEVLRQHNADMKKERARLENLLRIAKNNQKEADADIASLEFKLKEVVSKK